MATEIDRPDFPRSAVGGHEITWRRAATIGLLTYLVSRLAVAAGAGVRAAQRVVEANTAGEPRPGSGVQLLSEVLTAWDGLWYLMITRDWYPTTIPADVTYFDAEARIAFFPLYPLLVRILDPLVPGGDTFTALGLNLVLGAIAVLLVGMLARRLTDTGTSAYAMMLFALFPGSFVLSFGYAEALFVVLAAACLINLVDQRWLTAGLWGALATATRPIGVAIIAACAVAAIVAIRQRRDWRSLLAVAVAPVGVVTFHAYLSVHTDERLPWFRVQNEAWDEGVSLGLTALRHIWGTVADPLSSPSELITTISVLTLLGLGWYAWKFRLPAPLLAYSLVVVVLMLIPETVTARPRFILGAFPLFIGVAAILPYRHRLTWELVLVGCGAGLAALTALYGVFGAIP